MRFVEENWKTLPFDEKRSFIQTSIEFRVSLRSALDKDSNKPSCFYLDNGRGGYEVILRSGAGRWCSVMDSDEIKSITGTSQTTSDILSYEEGIAFFEKHKREFDYLEI